MCKGKGVLMLLRAHFSTMDCKNLSAQAGRRYYLSIKRRVRTHPIGFQNNSSSFSSSILSSVFHFFKGPSAWQKSIPAPLPNSPHFLQSFKGLHPSAAGTTQLKLSSHDTFQFLLLARESSSNRCWERRPSSVLEKTRQAEGLEMKQLCIWIDFTVCHHKTSFSMNKSDPELSNLSGFQKR